MAANKRFGMLCEATLNEAAIAFGDGHIVGLGSGEQSSASHNAGSSQTTTTVLNTRQVKRLDPVDMPAAGGPSAKMPERGRRVLGITGEVFRAASDDDPQRSTEAQRTWMPAPDAGIHAMLEKKRRAEEAAAAGGGQQLQVPPEPAGNSLLMPSERFVGTGGATFEKAAGGAFPHGRLAAYQALPKPSNRLMRGRGVFADE